MKFKTRITIQITGTDVIEDVRDRDEALDILGATIEEIRESFLADFPEGSTITITSTPLEIV